MKDMKSNFSEDTEETAIIRKERAIQDIVVMETEEQEETQDTIEIITMETARKIADTEVIRAIREQLIMLWKNMRSIKNILE